MFEALKPYLLPIKLGLLGVIVLVAFIGGCHAQANRDAGKATKAQAALSQAAHDLGDCRDSLRAAADTFDEISAHTRANADAASKLIAQGEAQAKQAQAAKVAADKRIDALEQQLHDERSGCVDAGRRVCGVPLQ